MARRKFKVGDVVKWRRQRRVVSRLYPDKTHHGGHQYYGIRMLKSEIDKLPPAYINKGWDGQRRATRVYWVRSDRLARWDGAASRTGRSGRPRLQARVGPSRTDLTSTCFCGEPIRASAKYCSLHKYKRNPALICACGNQKEWRSSQCRDCRTRNETSTQTYLILTRLEQLGHHYGVQSTVAKEFGISRQRVNELMRIHNIPKVKSPLK